MQTRLAVNYQQNEEALKAEKLLRSCVHCGFCTATCPTYQLLGDELDSPRGRIYLIKQMLEQDQCSELTRRHLDRCLQCRSCETTCPSGVTYHKLLESGNRLLDERLPRTRKQRWLRRMLVTVVPFHRRLSLLLRLGRFFLPLLPASIARKIKDTGSSALKINEKATKAHKVLLVEGCAQSALRGDGNQALVNLCQKLNIPIDTLGRDCCGALHQHLDSKDASLQHVRSNIDRWWPKIESGCDAIVTMSSACNLQLKEYAELLAEDPVYGEKAAIISALARDPLEFFSADQLRPLAPTDSRCIAVHEPCTLQHGQKLQGKLTQLLKDLQFDIHTADEAHLCCGAAGAYFLEQPKLSKQLADNKLSALKAKSSDVIVTANIGCQLQLSHPDGPKVIHWLELFTAPPSGRGME